MIPNVLIQTRRALPLLPLTLLAFCGCQSSKPAAASFASVIITNATEIEVRRVTKAVFFEAGYSNFGGSRGEMVFEKEGTRANQIVHGGWLQDNPVKWRVRAQIVPVSVDGSLRLQCKAYRVTDAGSSLFEEEYKLTNFRSGSYQKLLDEVAQRLR